MGTHIGHTHACTRVLMRLLPFSLIRHRSSCTVFTYTIYSLDTEVALYSFIGIGFFVLVSLLTYDVGCIVLYKVRNLAMRALKYSHKPELKAVSYYQLARSYHAEVS